MKLNATIKGLITGILMVVAGFVLTYKNTPENSVIQYIGTLIYGLGIVWSIVAYASKKNAVRFGELFQQGFKCFVMATLVLAVYTFIYWKANPEKIDKMIADSKVERIKTAKDRTPAEIEEEATQTKKYFIPLNISGLVFSNLLVGAVVTMAVDGFIYLRKKQ